MKGSSEKKSLVVQPDNTNHDTGRQQDEKAVTPFRNITPWPASLRNTVAGGSKSPNESLMVPRADHDSCAHTRRQLKDDQTGSQPATGKLMVAQLSREIAGSRSGRCSPGKR